MKVKPENKIGFVTQEPSPVKSEKKQRGRQPIANVAPRSGLFMKKRDKKALEKETKPEPADLN
jgi:hypothetical protein